MLSITVGEKKYNNASTMIMCFVYDPITKTERNIFAFNGSRNRPAKSSITGFNLTSQGFSNARNGIKPALGGYWSTMRLDANGEFLMKIVIKRIINGTMGTASVYVIVREGSQVGSLDMNRVITLNKGSVTDDSINVLSGAFEITTPEDAAIKYGIMVNPNFLHLATPQMYNKYVRHSVLNDARIKEPEIITKEFKDAGGEKVVVHKRKRRNTRKLIT